MRLEQLVLHGPGQDDRVKFGSGVTVFAGLGALDREELIGTLAEALTGRLPNASVVYRDHADRRVFADRTGATDAVTGARLPGPGQLLGHDSAALARLLTVGAADIGLGQPTSPDLLHADLVSARVELERLQVSYDELHDQAELISTWQAELEQLNKRIIQAQDAAERWAWVERHRHVDQLRSELAMLGGNDAAEQDRLILAAVDALRTTGQAWADAAAEAAELRNQLGTFPKLAPEHLARVAATPDHLPVDLPERLEAWRTTVDHRQAAEAALASIDDGPPTVDDPLVAAFAACDQPQLWAAHDRLERANEEYQRVTANATRGGLDTETEELIETAHLEVVRRERDVEKRFRPGALGAGALSVTALLAGRVVAIPLGVLLLVCAVAMGIWLIAVPRRRLTQAMLAEEAALSHADGGSWLGLHLRRLDAFTDSGERRNLEDAANARAAAQVDWDEVATSLSPSDLTSRADAVRAYVEATDPRVLARRRYDETTRCNTAMDAETEARAALIAGLAPWGVVPQNAGELDLDHLPTLLGQRIAAGEIARRIARLGEFEEAERVAGQALSAVLDGLGHVDGDLDGRLERAIMAVEAARQRAGVDGGGRTMATIQAEIAELELHLATTRRPGWADTPDPTGPPADPNLLDARRRDINELVNAAAKVDVVGAEHRLALARSRVQELEDMVGAATTTPTSVQQRIIARLDRTTMLDGQEDTLPVFFDEPLDSLPVAERLDLLDLLIRLSGHVQVVILTADPVVARWAQDRSRLPEVLLYEGIAEPAPARREPEPIQLLAPEAIPTDAKHHELIEIY